MSIVAIPRSDAGFLELIVVIKVNYYYHGIALLFGYAVATAIMVVHCYKYYAQCMFIIIILRLSFDYYPLLLRSNGRISSIIVIGYSYMLL